MKNPLYYRVKHSETACLGLLVGLLLGKIIPALWLIVPIVIVLLLGMMASILSRSYHKSSRRSPVPRTYRRGVHRRKGRYS